MNLASGRKKSCDRMDLECLPVWFRQLRLGRIVRLAPGAESAFQKKDLVSARIFEHPGDPGCSHSEARFIDNNSFLSSQSQITKSSG